jgi:hypothetical protein
MVRSPFEKHKILIWAKTYPELSKRYLETVCTAGVLEDGSPVRLYPIPYRYLESQFHKYQWITAEISKNPADSRPESYKVNCDSIECGEIIPTTKDEWGKRAEALFKKGEWQFETVDELLESQRTYKTSIGVVVPRKIIDISIVNRSGEEAKNFADKMQILRKQVDADRSQLDLFESAIPPQMKQLEFLRSRTRVSWLCASSSCTGHDMQILDWEIAELQRREGDAKALQKLRQILDPQKYALRFFLGNLFQYPSSFTIVGLWYPQKAEGLLFR